MEVVNATGALAAPTNFFTANSNLLNQAVNNSHGTGGGGGSYSPDGATIILNGSSQLEVSPTVTNSFASLSSLQSLGTNTTNNFVKSNNGASTNQNLVNAAVMAATARPNSGNISFNDATGANWWNLGGQTNWIGLWDFQGNAIFMATNATDAIRFFGAVYTGTNYVTEVQGPYGQALAFTNNYVVLEDAYGDSLYTSGAMPRRSTITLQDNNGDTAALNYGTFYLSTALNSDNGAFSSDGSGNVTAASFTGNAAGLTNLVVFFTNYAGTTGTNTLALRTNNAGNLWFSNYVNVAQWQPTNLNLTGWAAVPVSITNTLQPSNSTLTAWALIPTNQMMLSNLNLTGWAAIPISITNTLQPSNANLTTLAGNNGSGLTGLNAGNLSGGTVPAARISAASFSANTNGVTAGFIFGLTNTGSAVIPTNIPLATPSNPGLVQGDGSTISINGSGVASVNTANLSSIPFAAVTGLGTAATSNSTAWQATNATLTRLAAGNSITASNHMIMTNAALLGLDMNVGEGTYTCSGAITLTAPANVTMTNFGNYLLHVTNSSGSAVAINFPVTWHSNSVTGAYNVTNWTDVWLNIVPGWGTNAAFFPRY